MESNCIGGELGVVECNLTRTHPNTLLRRAPLSFTTTRFAESHRSESLTAALTAKPRGSAVSRDFDLRGAVAQWLVDAGLTEAISGGRITFEGENPIVSKPQGWRHRRSVSGTLGAAHRPRSGIHATGSCDAISGAKWATEASNRPRRSAYFSRNGEPRVLRRHTSSLPSNGWWTD